MDKFFKWLDETAGITQETATAKWLERLAFLALILFTLAAPHSIAVTQGAWILGLGFWVARFFAGPSVSFPKTPLNLAIFAFLGWSVISAVFSYAPDISIDKLRNVSLIIIFFFVFHNLRTKKAAILLGTLLIFSCLANVAWTPIERIIGRGVQISGVRPDSPLAKAQMLEGDALVEANGKKIRSPEELVSTIESGDAAKIKMYRPDYYLELDVKKSDLLPGNTPLEKLGIESWKHSRNWRSAGFYGHYTTYAEVLQLVASLLFGFFVAFGNWRSKHAIAMLVCLGLMGVALLLTVTRASQAAFLLSAAVIVFAGASRKTFITLALIAVPVAIGGLIFLQQSRKVGFYDTKDNSITWRQTVYKEGLDLATKNARHLAVGVGMDSIKRFKEEWQLFDNGKLPVGHFHSTPLQLAAERGIPALIFWLMILAIYARTLIRALKKNVFYDWREKGIILGCLGGLAGFFTSGLVHYNLGDGEVAMVFYLLMGIGVYLAARSEEDDPRISQINTN